MWAFFNRRSFVRQWQRKTAGLTQTKIMEKFHLCDINGDGQLNKKEFRKLLKSFEIEMSDTDVDTLMKKFDSDGNSKLNLNELRSYIDQELQPLVAAAAAKASSSSTDKEKGNDPAASSTNITSSDPIKTKSTSIPGLNLKQKSITNISNPSAKGRPAAPATALNSSRSQTVVNTKLNLSKSLSETENLYKTVGEQWLENVLQQQSTVEAKLGPKYYGDKKIKSV